MRDKSGVEVKPTHNGPVDNGSKVIVSTTQGNKSATMIGGGAVIDKTRK